MLNYLVEVEGSRPLARRELFEGRDQLLHDAHAHLQKEQMIDKPTLQLATWVELTTESVPVAVQYAELQTNRTHRDIRDYMR